MKGMFVLFISAFFCGCVETPLGIKTGMENEAMPSFNLRLVDTNVKYNTNQIPIDKPIVFFFLSPECPFCRAQTRDIVDNIELFKNIRIYLISSYSQTELKNYSSHFNLNKYANIVVAQDADTFFARHFRVRQVPCLFFYGPDKRLKTVLEGRFKPKVIKDFALN
jgi:thioredoxin-related protein